MMEDRIEHQAAQAAGQPGRGDVLARRALRGVQWLSGQAGRLEMPLWDSAALRLLADVAGAEAALLYWVEPPRAGAAAGPACQHGLLPADYQALAAVPSRVRSLSLSTAGRFVHMQHPAGSAGVVLVPVSVGGRQCGVIHLYCRELARLSAVQTSTLDLLGELIGYVHRHCVDTRAATGGAAPAGSEPGALVDEATGLFRESQFHRMLNAELDRAGRYGDPLGLILFTVGSGENTPDPASRVMQQLLTTWGTLLPALLRRMDHAFVLDPGTFAVLLPRSGEDGLIRCGGELQSAFGQMLAENFPELDGLCLRIGAAVYQTGDSVGDMLQQAAAGLARAVAQHGQDVVILRRSTGGLSD